jgi:hypothetical protein
MKELAASLLEFSANFPVPVMLILPVLAIYAVVLVYSKFNLTPDGSHRSILKYAAGVTAVGTVAGWLGFFVGVQFFCKYLEGNLCGFGGIFFGGPLLFSLAIAAYLYIWARHGKAP